MHSIRTLTSVAAALSLVLGGALTATLGPAESAAAATGATYSVDCSKKSQGDGSTSRPFNSLSAVNKHAAFQPGDRILLKRGTTCKGKLAPKGSGTAGSPIVLGAYGSSKKKPTVAGGGTGMETGTLSLKNQSWWTVQDLHVTNRSKASTTTVHRAGVLLLNDNGGYLFGVTVQRLTVDDVTSKLFYSRSHDARDWGGIVVHTKHHGGANGFVGLQILRNTVSGVGRTGITTSNREYPAGIDTGLRVAYNTVSSTKGDGMIIRGTSGARIDHNTVKNASNMWPCPQCLKVKGMGANAGMWVTMSRDSVVEHNNVYGTHVGHGDGEGIDLDIGAERIAVQYNYIHDNDGGGVLFCGSTSGIVRFNIFENNKKSAVAFIGTVPAKDSQVYNNTIYASKATGASVVRTFNGLHGSGVAFKNNVIYSYGAGKYIWPTKPKTSANTLIGTHQVGRPTDGKTVWRDPGLKRPGTGGTGISSLGGYKPKKASSFPKGVAIPKTVTRDFFGKKINPAKPPRGAAG